MKERVRRLSEQANERLQESSGVLLCEVPLQRLLVSPLLDEHVAVGLLKVGVDAVADAAVLLAGVTAHLGRDLDEALAPPGGNLHASGDQNHRAMLSGD